MSKILGYFDKDMRPQRLDVPEGWEDKIQAMIDAGTGIKRKDEMIAHDQIFTYNLLDDEDWTPEFVALVTPTQSETRFDKYRNQDWYVKSKAQYVREK